MTVRPTPHDPAVVAELAKRVAVVLAHMAGTEVAYIAGLEEDLRDALQGDVTTFARASILARRTGFEISDDVLSFLLGVQSITRPAVFKQAVTAWVLEHGVRFPAREGDIIQFAHPDFASPVDGECIGVLPQTAEGIVKWKAMGSNTVRHFTIPAENVIAVTEDGRRIPAIHIRKDVGFRIALA